MFGAFFAAADVIDLESAKTADTALYARYFHAMLERGVYFAPSQFEAGFVSLAHTSDAVNETLAAADDALAAIARGA
jgi:glutamate-1-semialdehyde 2,1-aminomutase